MRTRSECDEIARKAGCTISVKEYEYRGGSRYMGQVLMEGCMVMTGGVSRSYAAAYQSAARTIERGLIFDIPPLPGSFKEKGASK